MLSREQGNFHRCQRRRFEWKQELTIFFLVAFGNLSEAQNYNSQFNFNLNISPYPLSRTLNESIPVKNATIEKILDDKKNYCFKPECIHTASRILSFMDESLDPCDNFYQFACGQYMKNEQLSDDNINEINNFLSIKNEIKQKMKNILEQDLKPTEAKYVKLIKTFYRNCMNRNGDEKLNVKPSIDVITKVNGWSYLEKNTTKNETFHWEKFQSKIMEEAPLLKTFFFKSSLALDFNNITNIHLVVEPPSNHLRFIDDFYKYFYPEFFKRELPCGAIIKRVDETENTIMRMSMFTRKDNSGQSLIEKMTVKELEGNYTNILWRVIFNSLLQPTTEVRDDDIVVVSDRSFFKKFNEQINNISKQDQAIYLVWTTMRDIFKDKKLQVSKDEEHWEKCVENTKDSFLNTFGALYVKKFVNEETSDKHIEELITNIFQEFIIIIQNADWLDRKTKDYALEKLSSLYASRQKIYQIFDDKEYEEIYKNLEITEGDYYESVLNFTKFSDKFLANLFRKPLSRSNLTGICDATAVNAFNLINLNSFGISPGILQGIFFNESRPMYMNYGAIGSIVGHEFTHGFDSVGKNYDKNGNLKDWWEAGSQKRFDEKTKCFISHYQDYKDKASDLNVNGIRTQGENIADSVGLKVSYSAYQKWVKDHGSEPMLPGLNFTQSQLFWISFAQVFCQKATPNQQKNIFNTDEHSPDEFRVIGSFSNRPEFAQDFHCPLGSKMNPQAKCSVW